LKELLWNFKNLFLLLYLSIVNGVKDANDHNDCFELTGSIHHGKGADGTKVDFDLSVIVEDTSESGLEKGGGLKMNIFSVGMNSEQKNLSKNSTTQRIQFSVFINDSRMDKNKNRELSNRIGFSTSE
jgi:hypothetical protein